MFCVALSFIVSNFDVRVAVCSYRYNEAGDAQETRTVLPVNTTTTTTTGTNPAWLTPVCHLFSLFSKDVLVMTPNALLNLLHRGTEYLSLRDVGVLVFDECHKARKKHPYARIMAFYLELMKSGEALPKVSLKFGAGYWFLALRHALYDCRMLCKGGILFKPHCGCPAQACGAGISVHKMFFSFALLSPPPFYGCFRWPGLCLIKR